MEIYVNMAPRLWF